MTPGQQESPDDSLMIAAMTGDLELAQAALDCGARIDLPTHGSRPLHRAIRRHKYACAEFLIGQGADVNAADDQGSMPLHLAAMHGHTGLASLLMTRGADRHAEDKRGCRPHDLAPHGVDMGWDHLSDQAAEALKVRNVPQLASLLLSRDNKPTQALLELCGSRRLIELFWPEDWGGDTAGAMRLAGAVVLALPWYWRMQIDLTPLLRARPPGGRQDAITRYLGGSRKS